MALELDVVRTVELMDRLFSTVKCVYNENYELCEIIWEDMQAYLNGDKSLGETAELIQSKVGIYLSEQYG